MDDMPSESPVSDLNNLIYSPNEEISRPGRHIRHLADTAKNKLGHFILTSTANSFLMNDDDLSFSSPKPPDDLNGIMDDDISDGVMYDYSNYSINSTLSEYYLPRNDSTIHFSVAFQVVIYILYNTVFVAALLGNILVCYVVFSSPRMRTVTNYLIANLAIGDLLMALLCVPFSYISLLLQYWPFGEVLCHVVAPAQAVCVFVSAYTLVALAGDRYIAILYPLKPRLRRSQAVIVIFLVWAIAIITSVPIVLTTKLIINPTNQLPECQEVWLHNEVDYSTYKLIYGLALMVLQYFFPLCVLIFTYTRIALAVWGKKAPGEAEDGRDQRLAKAKRKMIKMMLAVVTVYSISWLPFNTLTVFSDFDETIWEWELMQYAYPIVQWLALAHTVCNPIIYCWMNSRFRAGFSSAISNVPILKKMTRVRIGRSQSQQSDYRLQRLNTCTTYTFVSGNGHGKLGRNPSVLSNGRKGSPASFLRNYSPEGGSGLRQHRGRNSGGGGLIPMIQYPNGCSGSSSSNGANANGNNSSSSIRRSLLITSPGNSHPIPSRIGRRKSSQTNEESFM